MSAPPGRPLERGLSLVELMIAMVIGLFLMAAVLQLFLGNNRVYRFQEALSSVQENARAASEFLARDIRMGGFTGCHRNVPVANVLNDPDSRWWTDFEAGPVVGYDGSEELSGQAFGSGTGERIAGTDAIVLLGGGRQGYSVVQHNATAAEFKIDQLHRLDDGAIVTVCDPFQASILQLTNVNTSNVTIVHNTGTGTPGNCTKGLGSPVECTANGTPYEYGEDSIMFDFTPIVYYVGHGETGPSLFRVSLEPGGSGPQAYELVEEVENMQLHYGIDADGDDVVDPIYLDASAVTDWSEVRTVRINLLLASRANNLTLEAAWINFPDSDTGEANRTGQGFAAADRRIYHSFSKTIALRNRLP